MFEKLKSATGLDIYQASITQEGKATTFLARRGREKLVGAVNESEIKGEKAGEIDGRMVIVGPTDHANALAIRKALSWTKPKCIGLAKSLGFGDRLGLATPGHIRAVKGTGVTPIFAQQSIREMTRTGRTPDEVMDAATWGVLQEGYREGFGSDADHIQHIQDIQPTVAAGFTLFTIDPGLHVVDEADELSQPELAEKYTELDFETLHAAPSDLQTMYAGMEFALAGGGKIVFDQETFLRAAIKYGQAIAHTVKMFRRLKEICPGEFELEVSVDETESPTSQGEHYFFAAELKRLGVEWVSMAPRFIGRFEKGVDYIGDLDAFAKSFAEHVAVMRTLGPYKISIHSGSDKFSVYPIVAELTEGLVHVKTAGTSYLEAVRAIATIDPDLFREILDFAHERYETDKATYHVSADVTKVPAANTLTDEELHGIVDQFDTREALHVTFGSVLTADDGERFRTRIYEALERQEETHYEILAKHLGRHVSLITR